MLCWSTRSSNYFSDRGLKHVYTGYKKATIIDGLENIPFIADIGIENGKIKSIEKVLPNGKTTIDASGLTVTPGFIDSHSHSDRNVVTFGVCERLVSCCS